MPYVIGQWERRSIPKEGAGGTPRGFTDRWMPPVGTGGRLDLRPVPARALTVANGFGLFDIDPRAGVPAGMLNLGASLTRRLSPKQTSDFEARFNLLSGDLDTSTLGDAIWRLMNAHADPTGANQSPPIMPKSDGTMRLRIGDYKRDEQYDPVEHPKVITRARDDAAASPGTLDALARKLGVNKTELSVPRGGATYGDTFTESSDTSLDAHTPTGANAGSGWTEVTGNWTVEESDDTAAMVNVVDPGLARLDSDLSSDDMTVYVSVVSVSDFYAGGVAARYASAADTCYFYSRDVSNSNSQELLSRVSGGTPTQLDNTNNDYPDPSTPWEARLTVDGSDLEAFEASVSKATATDSGITGNTRGGLFSDDARSNGSMVFDDFVMEDLGGGVILRANFQRLSRGNAGIIPAAGLQGDLH